MTSQPLICPLAGQSVLLPAGSELPTTDLYARHLFGYIGIGNIYLSQSDLFIDKAWLLSDCKKFETRSFPPACTVRNKQTGHNAKMIYRKNTHLTLIDKLNKIKTDSVAFYNI